ncbi:MAG TPA: TonB-dependent receptor [Candidatus Baltobacteraceae bacterium]
MIARFLLRVTACGMIGALLTFAPTAIPASAQTAAAQSASSVSGAVSDGAGEPVAGALVVLRGPSKYTAATDAKGTFSVPGVAPGVYVLTVNKPGYSTAVQNDVVVLAGQTQDFTVRIDRATFSSLRTIASVHATGRGTFNTSAASVNVVTSQAFVDQAQPQVTRVLSQIPGIQISFPSNSSNAASPGSITVPNIRGATSYETASLIDGHPISVGQYGDNVTTFLNSFMFGNVEVIKGPGADSPVVNNAIGGTTNFRTKEPTLTPKPELLVGVDNRGGTFTNFGFSDTIGRLGFVVDIATNNNPSALNGRSVYYDPSGGAYNGGTLQGNATSSKVGNTGSFITTGFPLLACCYGLAGNLDQTAELLKLRYRFSPVTVATVSYLGGQTASDQNGNTSDFTNGQFVPGDPAYNGSLAPGAVQVANVFPGAFSGETNKEPIFQGEVSSTLGKDTLLARYYNASITRYQFQGFNLTNPDFNNVTLYGVSSGAGNVNQTFSGTPATVGFNDYYQEPEVDKLSGGSFQYQHPMGEDLLTFSVDRTASQSTDYSVFPGPFYSFNLPPGTSQLFTTYLLRGHFFVGRRLDVTLSNYLNTYRSTYPIGCPAAGCATADAAIHGTGVTFGTTNNTHDDPRIGFVYRPNAATAIRFAAGSSIAPPFLGLLNQITSTPSYDATNQVATEQQSNGNLKPETGFGYDLGADVRLSDPTTVVSGDLYYTNLFNRFFAQTVDTGLVCGAANPCTGGAPAGTPILNQTNVNISNARFEGIELAIRNAPPVGFGYTLSGALQKGYYYDLPAYFYCSIPGPGCKQDQNLNIIAGQNTNGVGVGIGGLSYNGNMRIPYSQGNAEFSYTFKSGAYASFGETYFGHNNSLNEPAFGIAYATLRAPVGEHLSLQLSGDNIFNAYPGFLPIYGGGVPIPLVGGSSAATVGNVLGPPTYRLILSTRFP